LRHGVAGLDPGRRCRQRQRRIGRRADEIAGAKRKAIGRGDVARRMRPERRHLGRDAAQRLRQRQPDRRNRFERVQQRGERHVERGQRSRQALGWDHRGMVDRAALAWQPLRGVTVNGGSQTPYR